jgi:hypothetical protein
MEILLQSTPVKSHSIAFRVAVYLCLAALVCAALAHPNAPLPLAILAPAWFFIAMAISHPAGPADDPCVLPLSAVLSSFSPRPPPVQ